MEIKNLKEFEIELQKEAEGYAVGICAKDSPEWKNCQRDYVAGAKSRLLHLLFPDKLSINITQRVAILIDGNNIGIGINKKFGKDYMLNFDIVVPKVLNGRGLDKFAYFREGKKISEKLKERFIKKYFGTVRACDKTADIILSNEANRLIGQVGTIIIFSGDKDYEDTIKQLKSSGIRVELVCMEACVSQRTLDLVDDYYFITREDIFVLKAA